MGDLIENRLRRSRKFWVSVLEGIPRRDEGVHEVGLEDDVDVEVPT